MTSRLGDVDNFDNIHEEIKEALNRARFRFYISTSFDEFEKFNSKYGITDVKYSKYGAKGGLYWIQLSKSSYVGAINADLSVKDYMTEDKASTELKNATICTGEFYFDILEKKRLNRLDIEWTIDETTNNLEDLKEFLSNTKYHMISKTVLNAEKEFLRRYNIQIKNYTMEDGEAFNTEKYEKYINRVVAHYDIYAIDKTTGNLNVYIVEWYDHDSLQYVEEHMDDFIKVCTFNIEK